ncbi:protein ABIL1-like [Olea europaea var. sylvestris]|uniref:protein ABIL1-like n=1 Tax=Olea europaea var. sylvestris TaxID=158386 RepID=UPI000C1CF0F8|nr:protein ABIL1-like [Olea europaea var. sylvestris]
MAFQELKNLRPQLYSAAEYCEKSYLHSEQKQMVLDNLKDYAIRALVNAVDHLGTVASKLTDLLEQHTLDISAMDLKITCLNQRLVTCQVYMDKEGLRQQQLLAIIPRHHKRYILPNSTNKKVHFSPHIQTDPRQHILAKPHLYSSGASAAKTLSWHLASETKSTLKGSPRRIMSSEDPKTSGRTFSSFNILEVEESARTKFTPASSFAIQTRVAWRDSQESSSVLMPFRSFGNPTRRETVRTPVRSKSVLSSFFVKQKNQKLKTIA